MAVSRHVGLGSALAIVALCALATASAQKPAENGRAIPGYSLEQISRNFKESVAKAVEERLRKEDVKGGSVPNKQAQIERRVPAVVQPARPVQPARREQVQVVKSAPEQTYSPVPVQQVRREPIPAQQYTGQYYMDNRNGQVYMVPTSNVRPLPSGQVYVGPQKNHGQVFMGHQALQRPAFRQPENVYVQQDRSGVSYMTNQVFQGEGQQYVVPQQQPQQVRQVIVQQVREQPAVRAPVQTGQYVAQEFEAAREVPRPVQQVAQAPRAMPTTPVVRKRVETKKTVEPATTKPVSERFGVPSESEADEEENYNQAKEAHYSFSSAIQDGINDNHHDREEERDGLNLRGRYSYSDGFFKRTVHYEADEKGYRVVKQEVESLGDGPRINPEGVAEVNTSLGGSYSITAQEIKDVREAEKEGQKFA